MVVFQIDGHYFSCQMQSGNCEALVAPSVEGSRTQETPPPTAHLTEHPILSVRPTVGLRGIKSFIMRL